MPLVRQVPVIRGYRPLLVRLVQIYKRKDDLARLGRTYERKDAATNALSRRPYSWL